MLKQIVEAALVTAGGPLTLDQLLALFLDDERPSRAELLAVIAALQEDYADRGLEIVEVAGGPHKSLVEALALAIVDALLRRFRPIDAVRITIHKPEAPLQGKFADVGVVLMRRRGRA